MQAFLQWWQRFWFDDGSASRLGLCRLLFFGGLFAYYVQHDVSALGDLPASYYKPVFILDALHLPLYSRHTLEVMHAVWRVVMALACVGLLTRVSTIATLALGVYLIGLPNSMGKTGHGDAILIWAMGALMLSRCGDAWSIDALIARRWRGRTGPPAPPGEYAWPIHFMWLVMATIFFAAGVAKIRASGLDWVMTDSMQNHLRAQRAPAERTFLHKYFGYSGSFDLGLWVASQPVLCKMMAGSTIVIELAMILTPFWRRVRLFMVPLMGVCQLGMGLVLGVLHPPFVLCYLFWIPWDKLVGRLFGRWMSAVPDVALTPG
jgi:hypothetical protein